jgi:hypothetical protein
MKKQLLIVFLISFLNTTQSQDYIPLIDEGKTWAVGTINSSLICEFSSNPERYFFMGDTVINFISYKKVYAFSSTSITGYNPPYCSPFLVDSVYHPTDIFIREDITMQQVFKYNPYTNEEELLFDFSLNVGDTLNELIVDSIYFITTPDGVDRRYFELGEYDEVYMIEGIGGNQGPFEAPRVYFEFYHMLMCVKQNSLEIYGDHCNDLLTVETQSMRPEEISYYPNPVTDIVTIELPGNHLNYNVRVFDSFGKLILEEHFEGGHINLNLKGKPSGLYLVKVSAIGSNYTLRVVKR